MVGFGCDSFSERRPVRVVCGSKSAGIQCGETSVDG